MIRYARGRRNAAFGGMGARVALRLGVSGDLSAAGAVWRAVAGFREMPRQHHAHLRIIASSAVPPLSFLSPLSISVLRGTMKATMRGAEEGAGDAGAFGRQRFLCGCSEANPGVV